MKLLYLFGFLIICSFSSLAQNKFITVGSGGGFTGAVTTYKITPQGKVLKGKGIGEIKFTECGKIKRSVAKKMFTSASGLMPANNSFNHPGNLYYFLKYTEDGKEQIITWGDAEHPVPDEIKKLYEEIQARINAIRFKPLK